MRDLQVLVAEDLRVVEEDVDVEGLRLVEARGRRSGGSAGVALDLLEEPEQPARRQVGLDLDRTAQVPAGARQPLLRPGLCLVDLGAGHHTDCVMGAELLERDLQILAPIPEVRAEGQEHPRHDRQRLRFIWTPGTAATPSRGGVTLRTRTVTSRAG